MSLADMDVTPDRDRASEADSAQERRPGRVTAAARARAATRERLLESGQALFAELGLHKVTTHDIAAHAGVAAGTFYNHFSDKQALFKELVDSAVVELNLHFDTACSGVTTLADRVRAHATAMMDFAEKNRDVIRVIFSGDADSARVEADVLSDLARGIADVRRQSIASGAQSGLLDPEVTSQAVVGMWARVVAWWAEDPSRATRDTIVDTLTRIQLSGTQPGVDCDAHVTPEPTPETRE